MSDHSPLYKTQAWQRLRKHQLLKQPFCEFCSESKRYTTATVVDHVVPHGGDYLLFHDYENLQSLCKLCHDSGKQRAEKNGAAVPGNNAAGYPLDKSHHWNQ